MTREIRGLRADVAQLEVRANDGGQAIVGYAAVFNRYSQNLGGYVEVVRPQAFSRTLATADVVALHNHDDNRALGRVSAGSLTLAVDETGLHYEVDIRTSIGREVAEDVAAGILRGSSFAFRVMPDGETWGYTEQGFPLRELLDVELFDVSPVIYPAYLATDGQVALRHLAEARSLPFDTVAEAAAQNELRRVLDGEPPEPPPAAATAPLASHRRRHQLVLVADPCRTS